MNKKVQANDEKMRKNKTGPEESPSAFILLFY